MRGLLDYEYLRTALIKRYPQKSLKSLNDEEIKSFCQEYGVLGRAKNEFLCYLANQRGGDYGKRRA